MDEGTFHSTDRISCMLCGREEGLMRVGEPSSFDPSEDRRSLAVSLLVAAWLLFGVSLFVPVESAHAWPIPWPFNAVWLWMILSFVKTTKTPFGPTWISFVGVPFMLMTVFWIGGLGRPSTPQRVFSVGLLSAWAFPIYFDFILDGRQRTETGLMSPLWGYYLLALSHTLAFAALQVGRAENAAAGNGDRWAAPNPSKLPHPLITGRGSSVPTARTAAESRLSVEGAAARTGTAASPQILRYGDPCAELMEYLPALTLAGRITPGVTILLAILIGAIEMLDRRAGLGFHLPGVSTDQTLESFSWLALALALGGTGVGLFVAYHRRTMLRPGIWLVVAANLSSAAVAILWLQWNGRL